MTEPELPQAVGTGMAVANSSFDWYRSHAIRSRRWYRATESAMLILSAAIPVTAVLAPSSTAPAAVIGAVLVIVSGLRSVFHWRDNYLRYSQAREAIDALRRRYDVGAAPYDNLDTRERLLVEAVTSIEQNEMSSWIQLTTEHPRSTAT